MGVLKRFFAFLVVWYPFLFFGVQSTWIAKVTDDWSTPANWNPDKVPKAKGDIAIFSSSSFTKQPSISTDPITLGSIQFESTKEVTISGTKTLAFEGVSEDASIVVTTPGNTIETLPINLHSDLNITVSPQSSTFTISSDIGQTPTATLITGGTGIIFLKGANTYSGGVIVNSGTLQINTSGALGTGDVTLLGGSFEPTATMLIDKEFTISGPSVFSIGSGVTLSLSKTISGDVVTKEGAGTLSLSGDNKYTGGTTVKSGRVWSKENEPAA